MGGKQGRKKRNWLPLQLAAAMPLATLALAALAARLILGGKLPESSLPVAAGVIAGLVAFLGALIAALHSGRRKLLCGLGAAGGYALFLLLGNLLFFGVHYGEALPVLLPRAGAGLLGALLQMLFHAAAKIGVFLCAGSAIFLTGTETLDGFPGLGRRLPATMVCFTLLSLSLVGIPPFGGFFSKWYLISAALADVPGALGVVIAGVLLFSALLTAGYLFPPVVRSCFPGRAFPGAARVAEPLTMVLPLAVMAAVCLLLGLFPNGILAVLRAVAGSIL